MDSVTDAGNGMLNLYCRKSDATEIMKSCSRYRSVQTPEKADAGGLVRILFLNYALKVYM